MKTIYCVAHESDGSTGFTWDLDLIKIDRLYETYCEIDIQHSAEGHSSYRWNVEVPDHFDADQVNSFFDEGDYMDYFDLDTTARHGFDFKRKRRHDGLRRSSLATLSAAIADAREWGVFDPDYFELPDSAIDHFLVSIDRLMDREFPNGI